MLERAWRRGNPLTLLLQMLIDTVTVENSMEVPLKLNVELPYDPAIPLLGIYPEKTIIQKKQRHPSFTVAPFTIVRDMKQPKCP